MGKKVLELGLLKIFRYYVGLVSLAFLLLLIIPGSLQEEGGGPNTKATFLFFVTYGAGFLYLSFPGLEKILKTFYLPIPLLASSLIPIAITNTKFRELLNLGQPINSLNDTVNLVILLIFPLIITAWQYSFPLVFLFFVVIGFLDPLLLILVNDTVTPGISSAFYLSLIRILALGAVGYMITELRKLQRLEHQKLEEANRKLQEYAKTSVKLAESRERNRLSRELHDTLAHTLSGLSIQLEAAETIVPIEESKIRQIVNEAKATVRNGLNETRRVLKALRASPLEDHGLLFALERLGEDVRNRSKLKLDLQLPDSLPPLPAEVEEGTYRIAQEALENVIRHAQAQNVSLKLTVKGKNLLLVVSDDGRGIAQQPPPGEIHFGLKGMRERTETLGGEFTLNSQESRGTTIQFSWKDSL